MWCSVKPCDNCFDYASRHPQWCFAGSIRSRLDNGRQCDISNVSTNPICRGCLVKYCYKKSIVSDVFAVNKNNFNSLYIIRKNEIYLWGSIEKDENEKKYFALPLCIYKKVCTINGGKICMEHATSPTSRVPVTSWVSSPTCSSSTVLSEEEEQSLEQFHYETMKILWHRMKTEYKKEKQLFLEGATEEQLEEYFIDKRENELLKRESRDFDYTDAEQNGKFLKALILGERYVAINDTDMVDVLGYDPAPEDGTAALQVFRSQFEHGVDTLLKHFPDETIKKAHLTGMIKKLLEVIVSP